MDGGSRTPSLPASQCTNGIRRRKVMLAPRRGRRTGYISVPNSPGAILALSSVAFFRTRTQSSRKPADISTPSDLKTKLHLCLSHSGKPEGESPTSGYSGVNPKEQLLGEQGKGLGCAAPGSEHQRGPQPLSRSHGPRGWRAPDRRCPGHH